MAALKEPNGTGHLVVNPSRDFVTWRQASVGTGRIAALVFEDGWHVTRDYSPFPRIACAGIRDKKGIGIWKTAYSIWPRTGVEYEGGAMHAGNGLTIQNFIEDHSGYTGLFFYSPSNYFCVPLPSGTIPIQAGDFLAICPAIEVSWYF